MPATLDRSTSYALAVGLGYGVLAAAYIVVSSAWAADTSASVEDMQRIETIKGIAFVAVTTLAVFLGAWVAMRRIARYDDELLRRERALVASQGKVFAGVMAASIAHDANNVLTAVLADLDQVATATDAERAPHLEQLRTSVDRLVGLNRRLAGAARNGVPKELQPSDLVRLVHESAVALRAHRSLVGRQVTVTGDAAVPLATQPLLVHQIVTNLVLNAAEATPVGGRIDVVVRSADGDAVVEVHDDGPGIPDARRRTLFTSLETTKAEHTGLGLFSARACAQALGGDVEVAGSPLGGALLRVHLPRPDDVDPGP